MTYAEEKLMSAVFRCLAAGEGDARDRLSKSFQFYLFTLREEHFGNEHWRRFLKVKNRLRRNGPLVAPNGKIIVGAFENGKKGMKNKTARKLIEELVSLYREISKESSNK